ncbi:transketolase [Catalinimonas alkaloidigena]|uniref:transketolase n=1 Tax=Catalinimonas alkaloidigena TaxID=1075417 RepID=UPI0024059EB0|nr:transketolase [Catalinimonas alkaloidigena]MDF9797466.1 transketolase [Catalinimonas alkaloidigena]
MNQTETLDQLSINTIRTLSMDAVQKANSGHPGMPMGAAPMAHVLWSRFLRFNPEDPNWVGRDRFVLSAGHGCMLLYSLLHLAGYKVSIDDLKNFRQMHSITPGHPEYGLTPGVEVTTGPLGQGFAHAVGMAIAQQHLSAIYKADEFNPFDYHVYGICSDGDLMEGISSEAASMAGHMALGNLIFMYDDNEISIEGDTAIAFTEDVKKRFEAFQWQVLEVKDGNDLDAIEKALAEAKADSSRPSLIKVRTQIAFGSPNKVGTAGAHGSPLGDEEVLASKKFLGWPTDKYFYVPDEVRSQYQALKEKGVKLHQEWQDQWNAYAKSYPDKAVLWEASRNGKLPEGIAEKLPVYKPEDGAVATRKASGKALNFIAEQCPWLIGGSADLAPSNNTNLSSSESYAKENYAARNFHFGVREHAMTAAVNGMNLTEGVRAYGATFLIFSDYLKPSLRLAAIMKLPSILVFTHDSIGLGEDGTTHQPVEHLMAMRLIPGVTVIRPGDANETVQAWRVALDHHDGPVALALTRQGLPTLDREIYAKAEELEQGAYILKEADGEPEIILIASGSEVQLAVVAQKVLAQEGIAARVVSMPSWELFDAQNESYKESVLPASVKKRVSIEAGSTLGWQKYIGGEGIAIGLDTFGESAPGGELMEFFGFTVDNVVNKAKSLV